MAGLAPALTFIYMLPQVGACIARPASAGLTSTSVRALGKRHDLVFTVR